MAKITETIIGALGKSYKLNELDNGNAVLRISVATTPRYKKDNEWVEAETIWTNVTLWNSLARSFARSNFPNGTPLVIIGTRKARKAAAYTNSQGVEVPEHIEQDVTADSVSVELMPYNTVTSNKFSHSNGNSQQASHQMQQAPQQNTGNNFNQTRQAQPVNQQAQAPANNVPAGQPNFQDDPFAGNPMAGGSAPSGSGDIFEGL